MIDYRAILVVSSIYNSEVRPVSLSCPILAPAAGGGLGQ